MNSLARLKITKTILFVVFLFFPFCLLDTIKTFDEYSITLPDYSEIIPLLRGIVILSIICGFLGILLFERIVRSQNPANDLANPASLRLLLIRLFIASSPVASGAILYFMGDSIKTVSILAWLAFFSTLVIGSYTLLNSLRTEKKSTSDSNQMSSKIVDEN
jgi:hypothetical protein